MDKMQRYNLCHALVSAMGAEKSWNGETGSEQVIVWTKDGNEVMRSKDGMITLSDEFNRRSIDLITDLT